MVDSEVDQVNRLILHRRMLPYFHSLYYPLITVVLMLLLLYYYMLDKEYMNFIYDVKYHMLVREERVQVE